MPSCSNSTAWWGDEDLAKAIGSTPGMIEGNIQILLQGLDMPLLGERSAKLDVRFLPMTKIGISVSSKVVDEAVTAIRDAAVPGEMSNGRIYVMNMDQGVQIPSGKDEMQISSL